MGPEASRLLKRKYPLPSDGEFMILGPYLKDEDRALADYPRGTTCWYVILKWRGLELFIAQPSQREALIAAAEKVLKLRSLGD